MNNFGNKLARIWCLVLGMLLLIFSAMCWATDRGPDKGGYIGTDSTVYSFVDISGSGGGTSILSGADDGAARLQLPFEFQFYGQGYTAVCVSTNGALYFTNDSGQCSGFDTDFANTDITASNPPNDSPAVLPLWSDLTFAVADSGSVLYQTLGGSGSRRFVVQWQSVYPQGSLVPMTFQAILFEGSNNILFQYLSVALDQGNPASNGALATVGIRNSNALENGQLIQWSYKVPVLGDNKAILFSPDSIPPITSSSLSPAANANGWNKSNVTVTLEAADNTGGSGVHQVFYRLNAGSWISVSGIKAVISVANEGTTNISYYATDNAGNQETPHTLSIQIDKTPPQAAANVSPIPNSKGWNNGSVAISFSGTDNLSGIDFCAAPITISSEGAKQVASGTCTDKAGNVSNPVNAFVSIDKTSPVISGLPAPLTASATSAAGAVVTYALPTATDDMSGVSSAGVTCMPVSGSLFPLGPTPVTCRATDVAGNMATASFTITIRKMNTICATLGSTKLADLVDLFQFQGISGETVTVRLEPNPAAPYVGGKAALVLIGAGLLKSDPTDLPNVVTATLPKSGTNFVTVSEMLLKRGKFSGAYCVSLESSQNAWQTFKKR